MMEAVKIGNNWCPITDPDLWRSCGNEEAYFRVLRERQKKGAKNAPQNSTPNSKQVPGQF